MTRVQVTTGPPRSFTANYAWVPQGPRPSEPSLSAHTNSLNCLTPPLGLFAASGACREICSMQPPTPAGSLLLPPTAAVPVLLLTDRIGVDSKRGKLWLLAQTSLELCEAREACQPDHVIPQLDR